MIYRPISNKNKDYEGHRGSLIVDNVLILPSARWMINPTKMRTKHLPNTSLNKALRQHEPTQTFTR